MLRMMPTLAAVDWGTLAVLVIGALGSVIQWAIKQQREAELRRKRELSGLGVDPRLARGEQGALPGAGPAATASDLNAMAAQRRAQLQALARRRGVTGKPADMTQASPLPSSMPSPLPSPVPMANVPPPPSVSAEELLRMRRELATRKQVQRIEELRAQFQRSKQARPAPPPAAQPRPRPEPAASANRPVAGRSRRQAPNRQRIQPQPEPPPAIRTTVATEFERAVAMDSGESHASRHVPDAQPVATKAARGQSPLAKLLHNRANLRQLIMLKEVLDPPVSLR